MIKRKLFKFFTVLTAMLVLVTSVGCKETETSANMEDIKFVSASTLSTVERNADLNKFSELSSLKISAAKGESESAQFVLRSNEKITEYTLTATDLKCGENIIPKENVKLFVELYLTATDNVLFPGYYGAGEYPDCLIPFEYILNAKENFVEKNKNQGFWVDVKVPSNAPAGVYSGYVNFNVRSEVKEIPLSVSVFDFAISETPGLKTCYLIWNDWLIDMELDNTTDKHWDYYDTLLDYNITGYTFPSETTEDFVVALRKYYDKVAAYGIPYRAINKNYNDWEYYADYMVAIAKAGKEDGKNYFNKAYYYFDIFYDEATSFEWRKEQFERIVSIETTQWEEEVITRLVADGTFENAYCEMAQTIRNLSHAITTEENLDKSAWDEYVDMYVQHSKGLITSADIEKYGEVIKNGDEVWYYTTELVEYPNPTVNITDIPMTARDTYWFQYQADITGEMYWCVNTHVNCLTVSGLRYQTIYNPYENATHEGTSNGGGFYLYPGMHYGSDKPFPSMRLAVRRDGIDDYTYMTMLSERYKTLGQTFGAEELSAKNLISFMNNILITEGRSHLNEKGIYQARENLATLIEMNDSYGLIISNAEYLDDGIKITAYTKEGVSLEINGKTLQGMASGSGIKYETKIDFNVSGLTIKCSKDNESQSVTLATKSPTTLKTGFENAEEITKIAVKTDMDCGVEINTDAQFVRNGSSSAKVVLSGYIYRKPNGNIDMVDTLAYKAGFTINTSTLGFSEGLKGCDEIYFYVYNAGETREYEVYVSGDIPTVSYDRVILKSGEWTKVSLTNTNIVSIFKKDLTGATKIGLRAMENFYDQNKVVYTQTLYIDDIYVGGK